jgi:hypothetical protein
LSISSGSGEVEVTGTNLNIQGQSATQGGIVNEGSLLIDSDTGTIKVTGNNSAESMIPGADSATVDSQTNEIERSPVTN